MPLEASPSFEQDRNKYIDFRDMLADNSLSPDEVEDLQVRYDIECEEVESETIGLCADLLQEVEQYKEMTEMSREQMQKLQILTGIPKSQIDGLRGPTSFAQYQLFTDTVFELSDVWPQALSEKYDDIFNAAKTQFQALSTQERKDIQSKTWTPADGVFGPNTFQKICESVSNDRSLTVFLTGLSWNDEIQEPSPLIGGENDDIISQWDDGVSELIAGEWDDILESDIAQLPAEQEDVQEIPVADIVPEIEDIQDSWADAKVTSELINEVAEINPDELKAKFKEQSRLYPNSLIIQLQAALENIWVDGAFWNESADRILEKHPEITDLEDVFAAEGINTDIDGVLSSDGSPEVFRNLYGEYINVLGANLWLPDGFIEAIVKKESTYGAGLNSPTGAKWLMQLTSMPFHDFRWDRVTFVQSWGKTIKRVAEWVYPERTLMFQEYFQKLDLDTLLSIQIWDKWPVSERIPSEIITHLRNIQTSEDVSDIQDSMTVLFEHIKGNRNEYDHETNLLIWSVFLAYQYQRTGWNTWKAAFHYNWDPWAQTKYANDVTYDFLPEIRRA